MLILLVWQLMRRWQGQRRVFGLVPQNKFGFEVQESKFHWTTFGFPDSDPIRSHSLNQHLVYGFFLADADDDDADPDADVDDVDVALVLLFVPVVDADVAVVDEDVVVDADAVVVVDDEDVVVVYFEHFVVVFVDAVDAAVAFVDGLGDLLVGLVCALLLVSHIG